MKKAVEYFFKGLGSLHIAVPLLVAIAGVLAWGTIYEARFGTASVQRFIYHAGWFQALLGFLAVNLAISAAHRYPWKPKHAPFLLAHVGIILILIGGIIGSRFGIEGQLVIPEGQEERSLLLPQSLLAIHVPNPGVVHTAPTDFETRAWVHEPNAVFEVPLEDRTIRLVVDRYFPNAQMTEKVTGDGVAENPAIRLAVSHEDAQEDLWLLARDRERFGARWGEAHFLFLEAKTEKEFAQLAGLSKTDPQDRGVVALEFPDLKVRREIPVPKDFKKPVRVEGTPYTVTFKEYFTDLRMTEQGIVNGSEEPSNPAIAFTLSGPEGVDPQLLFALYPDFPSMHGRQNKIHAHGVYTHSAGSSLPPDAVCLVRTVSSGTLSFILTDGAGKPEVVPCEIGKPVSHPTLGYQTAVSTFYPNAKLDQNFTNRDNEVKAEVLHVVARDGDSTADAWVGQGGQATLALAKEPLLVEYRRGTRDLPVSVKLIDFRKIDYPGTTMAAGFEADVELIDPQRGVTLKRKISMNNPMKHRGFTFFQASYVPGDPETTVLAVRKDPGTPFVYAGFIIVIAGVVGMFVRQARKQRAQEGAK